MQFSDLSLSAKQKVYSRYVCAMDDLMNRQYILPFDEYCQEAPFDLDHEDFDENGNNIP